MLDIRSVALVSFSKTLSIISINQELTWINHTTDYVPYHVFYAGERGKNIYENDSEWVFLCEQ